MTKGESGLGIDQRNDVVQIGFGAGGVEVVDSLEVEPELGGGSESFCDSQGAVGGD